MAQNQNLSYGQQLVHTDRNVTNDPTIQGIKESSADVIDELWELSNKSTDPEIKSKADKAIHDFRRGTSFAVEAIVLSQVQRSLNGGEKEEPTRYQQQSEQKKSRFQKEAAMS